MIFTDIERTLWQNFCQEHNIENVSMKNCLRLKKDNNIIAVYTTGYVRGYYWCEPGCWRLNTIPYENFDEMFYKAQLYCYHRFFNVPYKILNKLKTIDNTNNIVINFCNYINSTKQYELLAALPINLRKYFSEVIRYNIDNGIYI